MYFLLNIIYLIKIFLMIGVLLTFLQFLKSKTPNVPRLNIYFYFYVYFRKSYFITILILIYY